jgi:hypothetical protein
MRKVIIKLEATAAVDPKVAKKKEQYKKKMANLQDNLKAGKARVADLEKQIKALKKEYGIKTGTKLPVKGAKIVNPGKGTKAGKEHEALVKARLAKKGKVVKPAATPTKRTAEIQKVIKKKEAKKVVKPAAKKK